MPMHIVFDVNPARKTDFGCQVSFSLAMGPHPLRRTLECANLKDVLAKFEGFKAEAESTGQPLRVDFRQHPRDASRKFPGFDKASRAADYFTTAAMTATEEDVRAVKW